jgi:hypothetical protein
LRDQFHRSAGFKRLKLAYELFSLIDKSGFERSPSQKAVHDVYLAMACPFLFGNDFERFKHEILAMLGLPFIPWLELLKWMRRNGKSFSMWEFIPILLYIAPGINLLVYTLESLIGDVMSEIRSFFALLPNSEKRIVTANRDVFAVTRAEDPSDATSGGGSGGGLRTQQHKQWLNFVRIRAPKEDQKGIKANGVFCDEAGAKEYTRRFFADVISVLAKVRYTFFVFGSTVDARLQSAPGGTVFGNLCLRDKVTGQLKHPEMMLSEIIMVCDDCKKQDELRHETCPHYEYKHPEWNVSYNTDRALLLMDGQFESVGTDLQGLGAEKQLDSALDLYDLRALETSLPVLVDYAFLLQYPNGWLMSYLDPAGGGPHSETAILTLLVLPYPQVDHFFVVGMDSSDMSRNDEAEAQCKAYFGAFRRHTLFSKMDHFLMVEANYGGTIFSSQWATWCLAGCPSLIQVDQNSDRGAGVWLNHGLKCKALMEAKTVLAHRRMHVAKRIVTVDSSKQQDLMAQFLEQLKQLQLIQVMSAGQRATSRLSIRGKDVSATAKDDLAIAWLVLVGYYKNLIRSRRPGLQSRPSQPIPVPYELTV